MSYKHGVYIYEVPTSIVPPSEATAGLPIVFGTAPVNLAQELNVNKPVLCYTYKEAVQAFGFSENFEKYTLCEFIKSQWALFNVSPAVLVNILDPSIHKKDKKDTVVTIKDKAAIITEDGVMKDSVVVKATEGTTTYTKDTDYTLAFDDDGKLVINIRTGGSIPVNTVSLKVDYIAIDPTMVDSGDIIGGVDINTGAYEGLELVNEVFPRFRLVPGQILAPKFSVDPAVAAVMAAKGSNVNGHFRCIALTDVPTDTVNKYTDVAAWKNLNNYVSERQVVCWPKVKLGNETFHMSTQLAGVICRTDALNEDVPYVSPSNKNFQMNAAVLADGKEIFLGPDQAAYLNGQGIVTALNFIGGWKCWGNRTGVYPGVTDPKDAFIPIRRMFDWIGNTLVLTFWQKVDYPINKRLIETITDSVNIWLNGLTARQFILGGRVEFDEAENPVTDLMDGTIKFHLYVTPPPPAREIDFILEYDPSYFETLFA